jgi:hypothetical protein
LYTEKLKAGGKKVAHMAADGTYMTYCLKAENDEIKGSNTDTPKKITTVKIPKAPQVPQHHPVDWRMPVPKLPVADETEYIGNDFHFTDAELYNLPLLPPVSDDSIVANFDSDVGDIFGTVSQYPRNLKNPTLNPLNVKSLRRIKNLN